MSPVLYQLPVRRSVSEGGSCRGLKDREIESNGGMGHQRSYLLVVDLDIGSIRINPRIRSSLIKSLLEPQLAKDA